MKNVYFFFTALILLLFTTTAWSQITITQNVTRNQIIAVDPLNCCGIAHNDSGFFLFSSTSNLFNDAFLLHLGSEKTGAQQTLKDLIALVDVVQSENVSFESINGDSYNASMVYKGLSLSSSNYAGEVLLPLSLLSWLLNEMERPSGDPWNSINDAANAIGVPERIGGVIAGGLLEKWGSAYYLAANNEKFYLGSTKEDALETVKEYERFASSKDQIWPVIIINSRVKGYVSNAVEFGAKTAYVKPSDGGQTIPLYQLYLKKYVKMLEKY